MPDRHLPEKALRTADVVATLRGEVTRHTRFDGCDPIHHELQLAWLLDVEKRLEQLAMLLAITHPIDEPKVRG